MVSSDYNFAEDKSTNNYKSAGFSISSRGGYISSFGYGNPDYDWTFFPSEFDKNSAGSVAPVGDYSFCAIDDYYTYCSAYIDGTTNDQSRCGGFFWNLRDHMIYGGILGARLIYIPATT